MIGQTIYQNETKTTLTATASTATSNVSSSCAHRTMDSIVACVVRVPCVLTRSQVVAFVHREWDRASVWLSRGVVVSPSALRPRSRRLWSVLSWIASVEPACRHPAVSPTPEPSTAVFQVCCATAITQSSRPSVVPSTLSLSRLPSTETLRLSLSGPFRGCLNP